MSCPYCGKPVQSKDNFCPYCRKPLGILFQSKNAILTNKMFYYKRFEGFNGWLITNMKMALVENNGSLAIIFNDGIKKEFNINADVSKADVAGLALFGGVGSIIAGKMAIKNQVKATSQQWAITINMLISKGKLPEMIFCRYCGAKNKSSDSKCINCGALLT